MAEPPPDSDTAEETGVGPDRESITGAPRWVKVFGAIALVLVVLVILVLTGRGGHGPGRHAPSGDPGGHTPPLGVTHAEQQP